MDDFAAVDSATSAKITNREASPGGRSQFQVRWNNPKPGEARCGTFAVTYRPAAQGGVEQVNGTALKGAGVVRWVAPRNSQATRERPEWLGAMR